MTEDRIALAELLEKGSIATCCVKMIALVTQRVMELDVEGPVGPARRQP